MAMGDKPTYRRGKGILVKDIWPTEFALSVAGVYPMPGGAPQTSDGAESRAIRCLNCGWPIKDYLNYSECPFCSTTNFKGDE